MFSVIYSASLVGIDANPVSVETDISRGLPQIVIVGLPDAAVNEARERVKASLKSSGFELPLGRIVINMAPADLRKEGSHFDLAIAVGVLASSGQISLDKINSEKTWLIGELSLNGDLRGINGILAIADSAKNLGIESLIVPEVNAKEAALIENIKIYSASSLNQVVEIINSDENNREKYLMPTQDFEPAEYTNFIHDIKYVKGQYQAKRALEICASGGHSLLLVGDPGSGKSMLTSCLPSIMPPLTKDEALSVTKIYSISGLLMNSGQHVLKTRPFRSPHHSISGAGLIGGGSTPKPGEISLAHHGVLFLDELAEFDKKTLDNLRQPIENGKVCISRARFSIEYPAKFVLVGACNPITGTNKKSNKLIISSPLWDRFGLVVVVPPLKSEDLIDFEPDRQVSSEDIRRRVIRAWEIQKDRFKNEKEIKNNAQMTPKQIKKFCNLSKSGKSLLEYAAMELDLTGRTYDHVLKTSRTIADLDLYDEIEDEHIAEAIQYRVSQESLLADNSRISFRM